jgi:RNA polymerase sigma factor (sigma-70 family)
MIAPDGLTDLVRQAQAGDRSAVAELLHRIRPDINRFAERFVDSSLAADSASDLAQEASLRVWKRLGQFQGARDDKQTAAMLYDWLQQLVQRLAANRREARHTGKRRPDLPLLRLGALTAADSQGKPGGLDPAGSELSPSALAGAAEVDARVRDALHAIPDSTDRRIIELCFGQGLSLREVADHLQLSYDKVRERHHAGLRFLERKLEGLL